MSKKISFVLGLGALALLSDGAFAKEGDDRPMGNHDDLTVIYKGKKVDHKDIKGSMCFPVCFDFPFGGGFFAPSRPDTAPSGASD